MSRQFLSGYASLLWTAAMLAFAGCSVSEGGVFPVCAKPGKVRAGEPAGSGAARAKLGTELPSISSIAEKASSDDPEAEMQGGLNDFMYRWFYGQGVGETSLNVGTVILFPPYALYLVANAGLSLSGFERISPLSYVPGEPGDYARASYDAITSVPGRTTSLVADEPFQGEDPCIPK